MLVLDGPWAISYFTLAQICYASCLITTHLYASWVWGLQRNQAAVLIIAGWHGDVGMTSWFTLAGWSDAMKSTCFLSCPWPHQEMGLTWGLNLWSGGGHLYGGNSPIPNEVYLFPVDVSSIFLLERFIGSGFGFGLAFQIDEKTNSLFWQSVPCYGCLQQARKLQTQWHPHKDWENISAASWRLVQENMRHVDVIIITHTYTEPFSRGLKSTLQTLSTTTLLWGRYGSPLLYRRSQGRERCFSSPYFQKAACTFGGSKMKS